MIVKVKPPAHHDDARLRAGDAAERQMAFYLQRAFGPAEDFAVLNDLRIEHEGDAAQMDHLLIHPHGFVIVESKSGIGGLVVTRLWAGFLVDDNDPGLRGGSDNL